MNGREMSRQTSVKQTDAQTQANRTNRWSKVQEEARCPIASSKSTQQQRQQRQRQHQYSTYESCKNLIHSVCLCCQKHPKQNMDPICKTASKSENKNLKIGRRIVHILSNMQRAENISAMKRNQSNKMAFPPYRLR